MHSGSSGGQPKAPPRRNTIRMVSNRSPYTSYGNVSFPKGGKGSTPNIEVVFQNREAGGLVVVAGIPLERAALDGQQVVWYAAAQDLDPKKAPEGTSLAFEREVAAMPSDIGWIPARSRTGNPAQSIHIRPVNIVPDVYDAYYADHANEFQWLLQHGFTSSQTHAQVSASFGAFKEANESFADEIANDVEDGDTVWINDYHLIFVAKMLQEKLVQKAAANKERGIGDGKPPQLNVVGFWHIPHATADEFRRSCPRSVAEEYFNAMTYVRWGFHSVRWADNYAECVVEFGDSASVNRLVRGLDSETRDRLIQKLAPHRLSRLFEQLDQQEMERWLGDISGTTARKLLDSIGDNAASRVMRAIPERIRPGIEEYFEDSDRVLLDADEPRIGDVAALSNGVFVAPATINPYADREFATSAPVVAAMADLEAELTELNGGKPFEGPRVNIIARLGDPKNGVDVELLAVEMLLEEGPLALFITGDASRQSVPEFRKQFQSEMIVLERIQNHPNARVIRIGGSDQVRKVASMRISDMPLIGARRGGRDIVGAEFGLAWQEGDRPRVPIVGAEIPISETIEGVYGGELVGQQRAVVKRHVDHRLRGAEVVPGIGPDVELPVAARRLYERMSMLRRLQVTRPAEFERRHRNYVAACYQENGIGWFKRVLAEAHPRRVIQQGILRNATKNHFDHQLAAIVNDTLEHGGTPHPNAVDALSAAGYSMNRAGLYVQTVRSPRLAASAAARRSASGATLTTSGSQALGDGASPTASSSSMPRMQAVPPVAVTPDSVGTADGNNLGGPENGGSEGLSV